MSFKITRSLTQNLCRNSFHRNMAVRRHFTSEARKVQSVYNSYKTWVALWVTGGGVLGATAISFPELDDLTKDSRYSTTQKTLIASAIIGKNALITAACSGFVSATFPISIPVILLLANQEKSAR
ncbi:MAG: hypothetical protein PVI40_06835 [Chlamydiota bacterium]